MSSIRQKIKKGTLLVSDPFMQDPFFRGTVVLVCDHTAEGTFGLIVNRNTHVPIKNVVEDFPEIKWPIYFGGPVQPETLHYVHTIGESIDGSILLKTGIYWGGNYEVIKAMLESGRIKKNQVRFFSGYAGWEEGQLEMELSQGDWIQVDAAEEILFGHKPDEIWKQALEKRGGNYEIISEFHNTQSLN